MLKSLLIQNYAIIDEILLEFSRGLNILTGETGAGKSIIVDALTMLLGGKVTTDVIRSGQKKAIIEGTFELSENHPVISILTENDFSTDYSPLIIRREILDKGISRNFINDSPVQAGFLKKCGELLIDFHGQHDHQSLLKADSHIEILDSFGTYKNLKIKYSENYNKLKELIHQKSELIKKRNELYFTQEQQSIKLKEIERVDPKPDEDKIIESELKVIENAEILFNLTYDVNNILDEGDSAVRDKINKAAEFIEKLKNIDKQFEPYYNDLKSASVIIDEVSSFVNNYKHHIEFDNERAETLRMRLLQIKGLQKKYGSIDNIINERKNLLNNLKLLENFEQEINEINKLIHTTQIDLGDAALKLSEQRKTTASNLEAIVQDTLKTLGIENAIFLINFDSEAFEDSKYSSNELIARIKNNIYNVFPNGIDKVEFYISPNIGEKPKPLSQIASGGEISRVMLSIKNALSNAEEIQLLVFDEIDSGISGRIAQKAGSVMKNLSKKHQIIAITHLPQIASYADRNISIRKFEKNNHTHIIAEIVEGNNRIYEIAKLFSGENINDIALKNAKKLINEAK